MVYLIATFSFLLVIGITLNMSSNKLISRLGLSLFIISASVTVLACGYVGISSIQIDSAEEIEEADEIIYNESTKQASEEPKQTNNSSYCNMTKNESFEFLTSGSGFRFEKNKSSSIIFHKKYNYHTSSWDEKEVTISGGMMSGGRLSGRFKVLHNNSFQIINLSASSGAFDGTNNKGSSGIFRIDCDGTIRGTLRDTKGNSRSYTIVKR